MLVLELLDPLHYQVLKRPFNVVQCGTGLL